MELRHLRYFVAVADALNFSRASERLNITRPALSKQIKDLEAEIGARLLDRDTVHVSLTDAGAVFLSEARGILGAADRAAALARDAHEGRCGELRIGSVGQIASSFLPEALKAYRGEFPGVEVTFVEMTPIEQLAALETGKIHLGFAYGRDAERSPGLSGMLLVKSRFGASMSRLHPFAKRQNIPLAELSRQPLLSLGPESTSTHLRNILHIFSEDGITPGPMRQITGFDSLLNMLSADQGLSLLPEVLDLRNSHGIVTLPLEVTRADLDFAMWAVWRTEGSSSLLDHFLRILELNRPASAAR